jgi:hypothetical protein
MNKPLARMHLLLATVLFCVAPSSHAFIYPVTEVIRDVFNNRKPVSGLLIRIRHDVELKPGEVLSIDETILHEGNNTWFRWQLPPTSGGASAAMVARAAGNKYTFASGGELPLVSQTWLRYVSGGTGQDFMDTAMREGFIRREQLLQFAPGYKPEGDPKAWDPNQYYLRHPDIYLHSIDGQPAISVVGTHDNDRWRAVFFDLRRNGVRRLEWRNGSEGISWTFNKFTSAGNLGRFAREFNLNVNGDIRIQSRVSSVQAIGVRDVPREKRDLQAATGSNGLSTLEAGLKVLLRYR